MNTSYRLQSLPFSSLKTYLAAAIFVFGNILMPQLLHTIPQGGATWLPIYFFTLVGAYRYGWRVGIITALASPIVNAMLFGMPAVAALPAILIKSVLLAIFAGYAAAHFKKATLGLLTAIILGYQAIGTLGEWAIVGNFALACRDFRLGIPGMILQIVGGLTVIRILLRKG